jgi:hypothetical protein
MDGAFEITERKTSRQVRCRRQRIVTKLHYQLPARRESDILTNALRIGEAESDIVGASRKPTPLSVRYDFSRQLIDHSLCQKQGWR